MLARSRPLIAIGYKFNAQKVLSFIFTDNSGSTHAGLIILTSLLVLLFALLLLPLPCIGILLQLMRLTPSTNECTLIWRYRSSGLLSVVGYSSVLQ